MLIKNSVIYGGMALTRGIFGFLVVTIFTRLLNPTEYGQYAILAAMVGFMDSFAFMWVRHAVTRHITHHPTAQDNEYLTNSVAIYAAVSAICLVGFYGLVSVGLIQAQGPMAFYELIGVLIIGESFANLAIAMARIRLQHILFFLLNVMRSVLLIIFGYILIRMGWGAAGAAWAYLVSSAAACALGFFGTKDFRKMRLALINEKTIRAIIAFGLPLVLVLSVQSGVRVTDRMLLQFMIGGDVIGLYSAAQDIPARLLNMLMVAIHTAAYQLAVHQLDHVGLEAGREQLRKNFLLLFGIGFPATVAMAALAPGFANIFVGEAFRPFFIEYLGWFAFLAFLNSMIQHYFSLAFSFVKKTHVLITPFIGALLMNLVTGYIGIRLIGVNGAVVGAYLAYIFLFFCLIWMARDVFPMPVPWKNMFGIIAAALLMAVGVRLANMGNGIPGFVVSCIIGGAVYAAAILALNVGDARSASLEFWRKSRAQT